MNRCNKILGVIGISVLLIYLLILPISSVSAASGIGVTPSSVVFVDVLPGSNSQKQLQVFNLDDVAREIQVKVTGDIANWISISPGDTISVAGKGTGMITVVINPPQGTAPGSYEGELSIIVKPTTQVISGGAGAEITPGAVVPIHITVGGTATVALDLISGEVVTAKIGEPLGFKLVLENSGNVTVTPEVTIEIMDEDQLTVISTFHEVLDQINPAVHNEVILSMVSEGLMQDTTYWAKITVTLDGKIIGKSMIRFTMRSPSQIYSDADLLAIQAPAFANVGESVDVTAIVTNIGDSELSVQFYGTASKNDIVASSFVSSVISVAPGAIGRLTVQFIPAKEGDFVISGMVFYGDLNGKTFYFTPNRTALLAAYSSAEPTTPSGTTTSTPSALVAESEDSGQNWGLIGGVIGGGVVLVLILALLWRYKRHAAPGKDA